MHASAGIAIGAGKGKSNVMSGTSQAERTGDRPIYRLDSWAPSAQSVAAYSNANTWMRNIREGVLGIPDSVTEKWYSRTGYKMFRCPSLDFKGEVSGTNYTPRETFDMNGCLTGAPLNDRTTDAERFIKLQRIGKTAFVWVPQNQPSKTPLLADSALKDVKCQISAFPPVRQPVMSIIPKKRTETIPFTASDGKNKIYSSITS